MSGSDARRWHTVAYMRQLAALRQGFSLRQPTTDSVQPRDTIGLETDVYKRRSTVYVGRVVVPYCTSVNDVSTPASDGSMGEDWGAWLRRVTDRPDWSVARLSRDSGYSKAAIFEWIAAGSGRNVKVGSVVAIARAAGEDPLEALRAAGDLGIAFKDDDPEIRTVLDGELPADATKRIIATIYARRERNREQDLQDTQNTVQLARLIGDQSTP